MTFFEGMNMPPLKNKLIRNIPQICLRYFFVTPPLENTTKGSLHIFKNNPPFYKVLISSWRLVYVILFMVFREESRKLRLIRVFTTNSTNYTLRTLRHYRDVWILFTLFNSGNMLEIVGRVGDQVALPCPVNPAGVREHSLDRIICFIFFPRLWRFSQHKMVPWRRQGVCVQSSSTVQ